MRAGASLSLFFRHLFAAVRADRHSLEHVDGRLGRLIQAGPHLVGVAAGAFGLLPGNVALLLSNITERAAYVGGRCAE